MSETVTEPREPAARRVARLLEATGHEVIEVATDEPGRVAQLVQSRTGLLRKRTYWEVWERCPGVPGSLDQALAALARQAALHGVERALAVITDGSLPAGYEPRLQARAVNAITLRRLTLELTGIADMVRRLAEIGPDDPCHPASFVERELLLPDGRKVPAVEHIESWLKDERCQQLTVVGPCESGKSTLLRHVAYHRARAFAQIPDLVTPLISTSMLERLEDEREHVWQDLAPFVNPAWLVIFTTQYSNRNIPTTGFRRIDGLQSEFNQQLLLPRLPIEELVYLQAPPALAVAMDWYRARLAPARHLQLAAACTHSPLFADFSCMPVHLREMAATLDAMEEGDVARTAPIDAWIAAVVARFMKRFLAMFGTAITSGENEEAHHSRESSDLLEEGALEDFSLGWSRRLFELYEYLEPAFDETGHPISYPPLAWIQALDRGAPQRDSVTFSNQLLRDYFLARKIAAEVRADRLDILIRHQFPGRYVLLILALIAPDVAARISAARSEALHAEKQSAVEHEVQVIVSHQLLRAAGALRANLRRIRKQLPEETVRDCEIELRRVDQELDFLSMLAEQTQRWHDVPESSHERITVHEVLDSALQPLRDEYPDAHVLYEVDPMFTAFTSRDGLREIFHCLLENAFQAVTGPDRPPEPRIAIRLVPEAAGQTVRIDIVNNGPEIPAQDRERIFEQRVTTKKGGEGQRRGTGMGLAIARRYATHLGARVGLDTSRHPETCFYVRLVAERSDT
jgi:signal transduction histidine kinase